MASTSRHPEVELTHAFEEVAPSASTSGRSTMPVKKPPYHVFINHRGPDVKQTLAATLYKTLTGMGLRVFLDSEELELGDFLPAEIEDAMRSASLHIAVFSLNYAQSPWCLAELSFMLKTGKKIVPLFYHVEPADVRYAEKGVYANAFSQHKKKGRYSSEKLQEWKNALNIVSYNVGHIVNNKDDEGRLLKNIERCVLKVIKNVPFLVAKNPNGLDVPFVVAKNPIGLDEIVVDFERTTLQSTESHHTVQFVGIWGMGGSGKTTLAKQLYNNKYTTMERSSFLVDVRDADFKSSLHKKQKKLLKDLGVHDVSVDNVEEGKGILASHLRSVRVLIVIDDVDTVDQLDALVPKKDSLGWGSLIVVTTREREVLRCWGISSIYKLKALDSHHAKQLFCWHAFMQPDPLQEFEDLVEKFLKVCNGLPLSLKVFGAQLYNKSDKDYWEAQLNKLSRILHKDIKERLKVSYVALDDEEKHIFLDSACFFIEEKRTSAIAAWDGLGWNGMHSWERLLNKCLVELDDDDCIRMHDHLRDMGREIASQQSPCRLWSPQQIINADNEAQRIGIRGIMATKAGSISKVEFPRCSQRGELIVKTSRGDYSLTPNLLGLKFFQVRGNYYNQIIGDKLGELVWLRWFDHGQRNLRSLSSLKNLRVLELNEEGAKEKHLEEVWETDDDGPVQLRELVISGCSKFQGFPKSIGCLRDLKILVLNRGNVKMRSLPESFCFLQSLEHLTLSLCGELSSLPSSFGDLRNLEHLDLSGCGELRSLPESFCFLQSLEHLTLSWCGELSSLPSSFGDLRNLRHLDLSDCGELRSLPESFCFLQSLEHLTLSWCGELSSLPSSFGDVRNLRHLDLSDCGELRSLPDSFKKLTLLQHLWLEGCSKLALESDILENMTKVEYLNLSYCKQLEELPRHITNQASLRELNLFGTSIREIPMNIGQLSKLRGFSVGSESLTSLPTSLGDLSSLRTLDIYGCSMLESLPTSLGDLCSLTMLDIRQCLKLDLDLGAGFLTSSLCNLESIELSATQVSKISISADCCPSLERLTLEDNEHLTEIEVLPTTVTVLVVHGCIMLRNIRGIVGLLNIQTLSVKGCPKLDALPNFAQLASLQEFELKGCYGVEKIQGLEHCTSLETLTAHTRWEEAGTESLERMERLKRLDLIAISRSAVEGCIPSMQKWPEEICVCTRAVPDSGSLIDSVVFTNLSVIDSISNQKIINYHQASLKSSSNGHCIMLYFVVNCNSPQFNLKIWAENGCIEECTVEEGKWVWFGVFTQRSKGHNSKKFDIRHWHSEGEVEVEVERGMVVVGEEERVAEAFRSLWALLSK